jgi:hypothetical protein
MRRKIRKMPVRRGRRTRRTRRNDFRARGVCRWME